VLQKTLEDNTGKRGKPPGVRSTRGMARVLGLRAAHGTSITSPRDSNPPSGRWDGGRVLHPSRIGQTRNGQHLPGTTLGSWTAIPAGKRLLSDRSLAEFEWNQGRA